MADYYYFRSEWQNDEFDYGAYEGGGPGRDGSFAEMNKALARAVEFYNKYEQCGE